MAESAHSELTGANTHAPGYVQDSDPGAVGAGKCWVDTSGGTGAWLIKVRNDANDGWEVVTVTGSAVDHGTLSGLSDDDHTQYQKESEKDQNNGYAGLDAGGLVPEARIAAAIARDSEVAAAIAAVGLSDLADFDANGNEIANAGDPTAPQSLVTRSYLQTQLEGITPGSPQGTYKVSGGGVTWVGPSDYTYHVTAGTGVINGVDVSWVAQDIALDTADPTEDRLDVIGIDDTGTVFKVTGDPAANPSEPNVDTATQLKLALVLVVAGTSDPTASITTELLYDENAGSGSGEWDWTTSGSGLNLASTNNPFSGTKDIEGTTVPTNSYAQGEIGSGDLSPSAFEQLVLRIRFKAVWNAGRYLQVTLREQGVQRGNGLRISGGNFGLDGANTTTYQAVVIPTLQFAISPSQVIDQIRFTALGSGGSAIGFYLDGIEFVTGAVVQTGGGLDQAQADARYQERDEKGQANGYASLDGSGLVPDAQIPSGIARDAEVAAAIAAVGLSDLADFDADNNPIINVTNPTNAQDAATKTYVDSSPWKRSVRAASTANVTLASAVEHGDTLDGVTLASGDRILLKNQSSGEENGIYVVAASGAPSRASDADAGAEMLQAIVAVQEGTVNADTCWQCTNNAAISIGVTALTFAQFAAPSGGGLTVQEIDGSPADSAVTIIRVTNGKMTDNGAGDITLDLSGGGGSASVVYTNALASPPGSPNDGDWWIPSDSMGLIFARVSSAWVARGPLYPMTDPSAISMAWVNQGSATVTDRGGLHLLAPATTPHSLRIRKWSAPATPWTYTFHLQSLQNERSTQDAGNVGVCFRQSSDGKLASMSLWPKHSAVGFITSTKWASPTSLSAHYVAVGDFSMQVPQWYQLSDDGTNRIIRYSYDGQNWSVYHSVGRTDFLTADEVGIFASAPDTTYDMGLTVLSITQS